MDIFFNDVKVLDQFDIYHSPGKVNQFKEIKGVKLQQGKNVVRIQSNGQNPASTGFTVGAMILGERIGDG